jgi:hypothetical protein
MKDMEIENIKKLLVPSQVAGRLYNGVMIYRSILPISLPSFFLCGRYVLKKKIGIQRERERERESERE